MTISGKRALRKKRFKESPALRVAACPWSTGDFAERLGALRQQLGMEHADVGQVSVALREIEPVTDHELVRDLEARIAHGHVDLAPFRLREQAADLERGGLARLEVAHQIRERQ